jgi:hypothetical protein
MTMQVQDDCYSLILEELKERQTAYYTRFGSIYISSVGAHMINIANKMQKFLYWHGHPRDTRLHTFLVAPSGFGKSFWQEQFIEEESGILDKTTIFCGFEQTTTEAGWVGTVKRENGEETRIPGLAEIYANGIIAVEEFSALVAAMQTAHSKQLDTALLTSLDRGRVRKKLGVKTPISYNTNATLWSGTQTTRFDISSGMGRRLGFMTFFPTEQDKKLLRMMRRKGMNVRYNPMRLDSIRNSVNKKFEAVKNLNRVVFDSSFYALLDTYDLLHYDEILYENLSLGYYVMKYPVTEELIVKREPELERIIKYEVVWRKQLKRGGQVSQVLQMIQEAGGSIHLNELREKLTDFQLDFIQSSELIFDLRKRGILLVDGNGLVSYRQR